MSRSFVTAAALACLAVAPMARADDEPAKSPESAALFSQLDTNQDGQLATDEIPEDRKSLFERLLRIGDKNSDGKLGGEEFAAALAGGKGAKDEDAKDKDGDKPAESRGDRPRGERPEPGQFFARLDTNGDGKVELSEVPEPARPRLEKLIARADKDGDGAVSREEFAKAAPGAPPAEPAKPGKPKKGKRPEGRDSSQLFKRLDKNADGKVTADEVPEERRKLIDVMIERGDKDGDGAISLEEFTVAAERRNKEGGKKKRPDAPVRPAGFPMPGGLLGALDADHDGQLNSSEIEAAPAAIRKLDGDGDGTVSAREIMAAAMGKRDKPEKKDKTE